MKISLSTLNTLILLGELETAYKPLLHYGSIVSDANMGNTRHTMFQYYGCMYKVEKIQGEVTKINLIF